MKVQICSGKTDVNDEEIDLDIADISEFVQLLRECDYIFDEDGGSYIFSCFSYDFHQNHFDISLDPEE
jgi:hypothetical protein